MKEVRKIEHKVTVLKTDCLDAVVQKNMPVLNHWHDYYEIEFTVSGKGYTAINNLKHPQKRGTVVFMTPPDFHSITAEEDIKIKKFTFSPELISHDDIKTLLSKAKSMVITLNEKQLQYVESMLAMLESELHSINQDAFMHARFIIETILVFILTKGSKRTKHSFSSPIHIALSYIEEHFTEKISLSDIAVLVHLTEKHLSKKFQIEVGTSFSNYILDKRLNLAKTILASSSSTISETAFKSGFNSIEYFSKAFKKATGMSPKKYQKILLEMSEQI